jgi:nitrogen regulatory protein P-II 2
MKEIVAIVKPFRAQAVLEAIGEFAIDTVLVSEAKGYGRQKDLLPRYRGSEYNLVYLPKIEIKVLVPEHLVEPVLQRITEVGRTGRIGDGKVFVFSLLAELDF